MKSLRRSLLLLLGFAIVSTIHAETVPASDSTLTGVRLPAPAVRLGKDSVPGEVDQALQNLIAAAGENARRGDMETLAWTGGDFRQSNVPAMMHRLASELERKGWTYQIGGSDDELTVFSLVRSSPAKRAVLGFYTSSEDALVLAWTEVLAAQPMASNPPTARPVESSPSSSRPVPANGSAAKVINVDGSAAFVNVMGKEMPALPAFPALTTKPGMVRGYVRDVNGSPIEGAALGVRVTAVGGFYSGAQGETDADGYYEFPVPAGMAHFYNAGVGIEWGDGMAGVGLHPVDGKLSSFASTQGGVENFVLLPYGITSRENVSESPHLPATYYGGALYISHWTRSANDSWAPVNNLIEGSMIELTLTAEGETLGGAPGRSFVIRRPANGSGFRINNIPVGLYRIHASLADGSSLKLSLNKPRNSVFGMTPAETTDTALIIFAPGGAKASGALPAYGAWDTVELSVEMP